MPLMLSLRSIKLPMISNHEPEGGWTQADELKSLVSAIIQLSITTKLIHPSLDKNLRKESLNM